MKSLITAVLLSAALLAAPVSQAASYQDRAMTTGAVVGATTGAVVGAGSNQVVEGAIFGAVLGTMAGAIIGSQYQPVYVVEHERHRPHYRPVRYEHEREHSYSRERGRYHDQRSRGHGRRDRD